MTNATHRISSAQKPSSHNAKNFRTFLLMQQFAAQEIGQRIAQARKESGAMTQEQLAELLNVSTRSVQDYEAGSTMPYKVLPRLEEIFKKPIGWFLHGDPDPVEGGAGDALAEIREQLAVQTQVLEAIGGQGGVLEQLRGAVHSLAVVAERLEAQTRAQ